MASQIITKTKSILAQITSKPEKTKTTIKSLIESPDFNSWIYLSQIITLFIEQKNDQNIIKIVKETIQDNYNQIKSFAMLMYLYRLQVQGIIYLQYIPWSSIYKDLCIRDNELIIFNSWAFNPQNYFKDYDLIQNTLQMISKHYVQFLNSNKISFTDLQFDSIVQWILRMKIEIPEKFQIVCSLAKKIKQITIAKHDLDYVSKQHLVIKKIFQNIGQKMNDSGNVFLLLQPQKYYTEKQINYFCHIYYAYLNGLSQEYLTNVFTNLTLGGVTKVTLTIIEKVSYLLANNQQFFKLRFIYQNFIIPCLSKYKAHNQLCNQIYNIIEFYAIGFLRHCYIGIKGIQHLLESIQTIQFQEIRSKWIKMFLAISAMNQLQPQTRELFKQKGLKIANQQVNDKNIDSFIDMSKVWDITLRTGKKHKKYTKMLCDLKGIQNKANECYIISVVQGLFTSQELKKLIDQYRGEIKQKFPLLDELRILFSELAGSRKVQRIVISYLKKQGPEIFRQSHHQQDAMQYLIQLFDCIESQCKQIPGLVQKFDQIFKIDCQHTTKCLNCQYETKNIQNQYIHTIPHTEILHLKTEGEVQQYKCQKCNKVGHCKNTRIISPKCKLFIVHINRFSLTKDGKCKKQLSNQTILRHFLKYQLIGILCHIGKNIDSGHYIYFTKIDDKTWVELNDRMAYKFQLDDPQEEFEREMNVDMSPYILFYRKRQ